MMQVIAHRGYWLKPEEKNTEIAFARALQHGFGIETDFRDSNGKLVISHDVPEYGAYPIDQFIKLFRQMPVDAPIAINVKSDGLYGLVKDLIVRSGVRSYFVFDMSVPDTLGYLSANIPVYTRLSEYEPTPALLNKCKGVWLDAFEREWYDDGIINELLEMNKSIAFVSPELHKRPYIKMWEFLIDHKLHLNSRVSICTDFPLDAKEFFYAKN
jgi:hypothetical protein